MGRTAKGLGFLLLVAVLGAGCGTPQPSPQLTLSIANETSIAVGPWGSKTLIRDCPVPRVS
jgi:hypothetical protein